MLPIPSGSTVYTPLGAFGRTPRIAEQLLAAHEFAPAPVHANPASTMQALSQPSPFSALPSSQASPPRTNPSPQIGVHAPPCVGHVKPPSTAVQLALQPSPPAVSPSSQASLAVFVPSPQTSLGATTHWPARLQLASPVQAPQTMPSTTPQSRPAQGSLTPAGVQPAVKPVALNVKLVCPGRPSTPTVNTWLPARLGEQYERM